LGGRGRWISEFKASLVYRVSSRTARATQRNPVSKKKKNKFSFILLDFFFFAVSSDLFISIYQVLPDFTVHLYYTISKILPSLKTIVTKD
jgi:hypothetical protein